MEVKKEIEERLRAEFAASEDLQVEFGGEVESYIAFKKAESEDRVRTRDQN